MANSTISLQVTPKLNLIQRMFLRIAGDIQLQKKVEEYAYSIEHYAKMRTPVDTGLLRSSIRTDIGNLKAAVGPHTNYGIYVHEGTRRMAGRPFMRWGKEMADAIMWHGKPPLQAHIKSIIDKNLI